MRLLVTAAVVLALGALQFIATVGMYWGRGQRLSAVLEDDFVVFVLPLGVTVLAIGSNPFS